METSKPPIGITPTDIWLINRVQEIDTAIRRYEEAHYDIPDHWIRERQELVKWIFK